MISAIRSVTLRVSAPCRRHVEEDDLGGNLDVDRGRAGRPGGCRPICCLNRSCELRLADRAVLEGVAEVLGERAFARAEEAGDPDADALVRLGRGLGDGLEQGVVLVPDAVGGDVLGDLGVDRLLVGLVDLDDLLDLPRQVAGEQVADRRHGVASGSAVNLDPVVAQRLPVLQVHEPQPGRPFDGCRDRAGSSSPSSSPASRRGASTCGRSPGTWRTPWSGTRRPSWGRAPPAAPPAGPAAGTSRGRTGRS